VADLKRSAKSYSMNAKSIRSVVLAVAMLLGSSVATFAVDAPKADVALIAKLVAAIVTSDYEAYVSVGDSDFRRLEKEEWEVGASRLGPKLKAGHEISYLGELKQGGFRVILWKIRFKDGSDDALATLLVKEGKVGGFFL
jgi:hypothetical protein